MKEDVGLPFQAGRNREGARFIGVADRVGRGNVRSQHPVPPLEIGAAEGERGELFAGAQHTPDRNRAFGLEEVAMGPARLDPRAFAGAVADLPRDRARRGGFQRDRDIDRSRGLALDRLDLGRGDQPGLDQRAAQIV